MKYSKALTRWETIKIFRKHSKLSDKRNVAFEQNRVAKVFGYIMMAFVVFYLMFFAVMFSLIANSSHRYTACEIMSGILPFILVIDFFSRFALQQTPSQRIKPYVLLPISKYACIDSFLFNSATSLGNLIWLALFVPYTIMSILFVQGVGASLGFLLAMQLLIVANSLWYMLTRTLVNHKFYWWILPVVVYAAIFSPWYIGKDAGITKLCETYSVIGEGATKWSIIVFAGIFLLIFLLLVINRRIQFWSVYYELAKVENTKIKHISQFKQLDRLGELGEYIKLEIKSIMRNKNIRKTFISANILILMFSLLISFTNIYEGGMTKFLAVYNFALYGALVLVKVMCYEGNYIDCLMVHKENIISLLKAKYFLYSTLLVLPMLLMLPTVFMGKCSFIMLLSLMFLTAGPVHATFLYMAIFNKQTIPLNTKFIGKGSVENNFLQIGVEFAAFILPLVFINLFPFLFGEIMGPVAILIMSIVVILLNKYWIRDIYKRLMKRRYENLESFWASR